MTISRGSIVFWIAFFVFLTICNFAHFHGFKGAAAAGFAALIFVLISRNWWQGNRPIKPSTTIKRPPKPFDDPTLGARAARRAAKRNK